MKRIVSCSPDPQITSVELQYEPVNLYQQFFSGQHKRYPAIISQLTDLSDVTVVAKLEVPEALGTAGVET